MKLVALTSTGVVMEPELLKVAFGCAVANIGIASKPPKKISGSIRPTQRSVLKTCFIENTINGW